MLSTANSLPPSPNLEREMKLKKPVRALSHGNMFARGRCFAQQTKDDSLGDCFIVPSRMIERLWKEGEDSCSCAGCKLARACLGKKGVK